jgi:hypothetical protein
MKFRFVFCLTRQYIPKDKSGRYNILIAPIFQIQDTDQSLKPSSILAGYQSELASCFSLSSQKCAQIENWALSHFIKSTAIKIVDRNLICDKNKDVNFCIYS